ncbi:MAG: thiol-disulfide isomerase/thioredoxin [Paraglaciecola sp.]|jgi:thiol-disulfide isomerase/thioredoxin
MKNSKNTFQLMSGITLVLLATAIFTGCFQMENRYTKVAPGKWRAVLKLEDNPITPNPEGKPLPEKMNMQFEEVTLGELPFNFEVVYEDDTKFHIEIINGEERIKVTDITFGRGKERAMDSIRINFPLYETYITAWVEGNLMEGYYYVPAKGNYKIPFVATHGKAHRFTSLQKPPQVDLTGKWETTFGLSDGEEPYGAIGEFDMKDNRLTGTFRTETGDYRFLEGTVQGKKMYLSCFDGSHAFLFEGKIKEDSTIIGSFRSGKHYRTIWKASQNNDAKLGSPDSLTFLKEGYESVEFGFKNPDGKMISLDNPEYQNKVKIVQILGTWCPNCRDETTFLIDYLKKNNHPDLEVVALAFEKYKEKEKGDNAINIYKKHFQLPYEMVYAGYYNKIEAAEKLPMLNHILSYPTMIFLDRNNKVRRIHTGFEGPATSQFKYFSKDFDEFVKGLLNEKEVE